MSPRHPAPRALRRIPPPRGLLSRLSQTVKHNRAESFLREKGRERANNISLKNMFFFGQSSSSSSFELTSPRSCACQTRDFFLILGHSACLKGPDAFSISLPPSNSRVGSTGRVNEQKEEKKGEILGMSDRLFPPKNRRGGGEGGVS